MRNQCIIEQIKVRSGVEEKKIEYNIGEERRGEERNIDMKNHKELQCVVSSEGKGKG